MDNQQEHRRRKSQKLIYELIVSRQRSEQSAVIEIAKAFDNMNNDEKESFESRKYCLNELNFALDWFIDKVLCDRRK
jgi:hypothetical protein